MFQRRKKKTPPRGQMTIFLGVAMLIIITIMAFTINVGLFVKAKINFQNSVDAAAYAGASVQARLMTNIAHLNWEMRNVYKEWMFKYYVIGHLGRYEPQSSDNAGLGALGSIAGAPNFRMRKFNATADCDPFNIPSVCMDVGTEFSICKVYSVPGVPRFSTGNISGIGELHEGFLDEIVNKKSKDCSMRSVMNFGVAAAWAYGTDDVMSGVPSIASHRLGAWPASLILAIRIRNLEMMMNRPPVPSMCTQGSIAGCANPMDTLAGGTTTSLNERPVKAFFTAFRNLQSEELSVSEEDFRSMKANLVLSELEPVAYSAPPSSLSGMLIPGTSSNPIVDQPLQKYYLDLQVIPLNLAPFFTTFVSTTGVTAGTTAEGACGASKTALPVPNYLFGFVKNPKVLTYYAIEATTKYSGLFFPFRNRNNGVEFKAYAAAKPYGGRIGPQLFTIPDTNDTVQAKVGRSANYAVSFTPSNAAFASGDAIPLDPDFWAKASTDDPIGGTPGTGVDPKFVIPNLLYDFEGFGDLATGGSGSTKLGVISKDCGSSMTLGLYNSKQLSYFTDLMEAGAQSDSARLDEIITSVHQPTLYESLNYMIPTPETGTDIENTPTVNFHSDPATYRYGYQSYSIYAPLWGEGTLYREVDDITSALASYINSSISVIESTYQDAMKEVSIQVNNSPNANGAGDSFWVTTADDCTSLYGKMHTLIAGEYPISEKDSHCGIIPLRPSLEVYIKDRSDANYHIGYYVPPGTGRDSGLRDLKLMLSAFSPTVRMGANTNHQLAHPLTDDGPYSVLRNSYSTKLVRVENLLQGENYGDGAAVYTEARSGFGDVSSHGNGQIINGLTNPPSSANLDH